MRDDLTRASIDATEAAAWSRSGGLLSGGGSSDDELKTRVSFEAGADFRKLAAGLGMSTSELLRLLVLTRLYGVEGVTRMTRTQLEVAAGVGTK